MRPDWTTYFLTIAETVATRATCPRKHVGAVLVRDKVILSTGFNGSMAGMPHCEDVGCDIVDNHCQNVLHAEMNAAAQAARNGIRLEEPRVTVHCHLVGAASSCWSKIDQSGIRCYTQRSLNQLQRVLLGLGQS